MFSHTSSGTSLSAQSKPQCSLVFCNLTANKHWGKLSLHVVSVMSHISRQSVLLRCMFIVSKVIFYFIELTLPALLQVGFDCCPTFGFSDVVHLQHCNAESSIIVGTGEMTLCFFLTSLVLELLLLNCSFCTSCCLPAI